MSNVFERRLRGMHALLEKALKEERSRPRPSDHVIATLKKKKLSIKDRLLSLDRRIASAQR